MMFHILKGGFPFWISIWFFHIWIVRILLLKKLWMIVMFMEYHKFLLKSMFLNLFFKMSNHHNHFRNLYEDPHMFKDFQESMIILKHEFILKVMLLQVQLKFLMTVDSIILQLVNLVVLNKLLIVMNGRMQWKRIWCTY